MRAVLSVGAVLLLLGMMPARALADVEAEASNASGVNDTIAAAQAIGAVGATPLFVDGFVSTADDNDVDFYSFTGEENQFIALGISRGDGTSGSTDDVDTELSLFTAAGTLIAHNDDRTSNSGYDALIGNVRLPATGTYFVAVTSDDNAPNALGQADITLTGLLLSGDLVTAATPDETFSDNGNGGGDYTLTILDSNVLKCVAHSVEEGDHANLPFDAGRRKVTIYNGAPLAQIGVSGIVFGAGEGDFDLRSMTFGPDRDPNGLIHFAVEDGTSSSDVAGTGTATEQARGNRANNVYSSLRDGNNGLAIPGWTLGYTPGEGGVMDALNLGCASDEVYPIFQGSTIVGFVNDHTFPLYFTIDDDNFSGDNDGEADILVVTSSSSAPRIFKVAAELGLDDGDEIDALVKVQGGFLFSVDDSLSNSLGLPGTAVRTAHDAASAFIGSNIYFTPCDGTNTLFIAGQDLGFLDGSTDSNITALDIPFDAPPPPSSGLVGEPGPPGGQGPPGAPGGQGPAGQTTPTTTGAGPSLVFSLFPFLAPFCGVALMIPVPLTLLLIVGMKLTLARRRRRPRL